MANPRIRSKRSSVEGKVPAASQLMRGEFAVNSYDGKVYILKDQTSVGIATTTVTVNPWDEPNGVGAGVSYSSDVNILGVVTATSFVGDGSGLTGISVAGVTTFSGNYNHLYNTPTIPTNNNQLTNGAGYITAAEVGIATGSTRVLVDESEDDNNFYNILFTDVTPGAGNQYHTLQVDNAGLRFNPQTNVFDVQNIEAYGVVYSNAFYDYNNAGTSYNFDSNGDAGILTNNTPNLVVGVDGNTRVTNSLNVSGITTSNGVDVTGNITVSGTVDGVDVAALNSTVAGIDTSGFITDYTVTESDVTNHQAALSITESQISDLGTYLTSSDLSGYVTSSSLATVATSGSYNDLSNRPTIPTNNNQLTNGAGYITGYTVTESDVTSHQAALSITESQISDLGTYLTSSDLSSYATTSYVDTEVAGLVDSAPGTLNTLNELAAALGDDANFSTTVTNSIAAKLPLSGGTMTGNITFASGQTFNYNNLTNTPTIPTNNNQLTNGAGYITSFDITTQTDSKYLRSNASDTTTGNITIQRTNPNLLLKGTGTSTGYYPTLRFNTGNNQGVMIEHNEFDGELPTAGYGLIVTGDDDNTQFPSTGTLSFSVLGNIYAGGTSVSALSRVLTTADEGSGNGLDADTVDGIQASSFLRSDTSDTFTSLSGTSITIGNGVVLSESSDRADLLQISSNTSGWGGLQIRNSSNEGRWSFMVNGSNAGIYDDENSNWHVYLTENGSTQLRHNGDACFVTTGSSSATIGGNTVWHAGNDGSGSGLDADTVDGIHASSFLRSDAADSFSGALTGSGTISVTGTKIECGRTSGSVAMTTNDGYGNANLCFNHTSGTPDTGGSACRIETSVDSATGSMMFEVGNSVTSGTAVQLTEILKLATAEITAYRSILPNSNNSRDLGSSSLRFRNVYTNDLNLSNEGGANDVDGTWGDWTMQEGENDMFMINNRTGNKFRIKLEPVE